MINFNYGKWATKVGTCMIKEDISFTGYKGFYMRKDVIKIKYNRLTIEEKWVYKYYVYSKRHLKEYTCDLIWRFLNDEEEPDSLVTDEMLLNECCKYRM